MNRWIAVVLLSVATVSPALAELTSGADPIIEWTDGDLLIQARPLIVTSSSPPAGGDRVVSAGTPASLEGVDIDLDGVGSLFLDTNPSPGLGALCSGSLLSDGRTLLTAAHCVTDASGMLDVLDGGDGNSVRFQTPSGTVIRQFSSSDITTHPSWNGNLFDGFDVAVIDLGAPLPPSVPRYELNTSTEIEGSTHLAAGYGRTGDGATGALLDSGTLRSGLNNFVTAGLPVGGITNPQTQLVADFDSGSSANDAFDFHFGLVDGLTGGLGFGPDEVGTAPGDSGGPTFVLDGGQPVIAGVHSYNLRLTSFLGQSADVDGTLNASFGEFYGDARVADPDVLSFIQGELVSFALGDLDLDGDIDADDIDLLAANDGSGDPFYDLNSDGVVEFSFGTSGLASDSDFLVRSILGTEYGDANLDGVINATDFSTLSGSFGQLGGWALGDFDGSSAIDATDFSILTGGFNFGVGTGSLPVPEAPTAGVIVIAAAFARSRCPGRRIRRRPPRRRRTVTPGAQA